MDSKSTDSWEFWLEFQSKITLKGQSNKAVIFHTYIKLSKYSSHLNYDWKRKKGEWEKESSGKCSIFCTQPFHYSWDNGYQTMDYLLNFQDHSDENNMKCTFMLWLMCLFSHVSLYIYCLYHLLFLNLLLNAEVQHFCFIFRKSLFKSWLCKHIPSWGFSYFSLGKQYWCLKAGHECFLPHPS